MSESKKKPQPEQDPATKESKARFLERTMNDEDGMFVVKSKKKKPPKKE